MKTSSRANCINLQTIAKKLLELQPSPTPSLHRGEEAYIRYRERQRGVPGTIRTPGGQLGYPLPRYIFLLAAGASGPAWCQRNNQRILHRILNALCNYAEITADYAHDYARFQDVV